VRNIVEKGGLPPNYCSSSEECVLLYYAVLDVVKAISDKWLQNRVALVYSKYASHSLNQESSEKLLLLGRKLGLDVNLVHGEPNIPRLLVISGRSRKIRFVPCEFAISVTSYLRVVSKRLIHDQTYSLINNIVSGGYVYLDRKTYQRLLEEAILNKILSAIEETTPSLSDEFVKIVTEVEKILTETRRDRYVEYQYREYREPLETTAKLELKSRELPVIEELFPPCIEKIINTLRSGGNPGHIERFNLAAFLGSIGLSPESVLEYFKTTADFNEKIARYQVEHILGIRGGKKKYLPYSCEKMKLTGICPIQEQCEGGKNPITVYKYTVRKRLKNNNTEKSSLSRDDQAAGGI